MTQLYPPLADLTEVEPSESGITSEAGLAPFLTGIAWLVLIVAFAVSPAIVIATWQALL
jgi:hypothetical protein